LPKVDFDRSTERALDDLADFVEAGHTGEEIQGQMYELPEEYGIETGRFFGAGYRLFFDADSGPRLGEFLGELDRTFVVRRLRREG
jgi:lysyl-tRNA synthetase class 1